MDSQMNMVEVDRSIASVVHYVAKIVLRYNVTFLSVAIVFFMAVGWLTLQIQPRYEATVQLISGHRGLEKESSNMRQPIEMPAALSAIAESAEVIRVAVEKVGLEQVVGRSNPAGASLSGKIREVAAFLRDKIGAAEFEVRQSNVTTLEKSLPLVKQGLIVVTDPKAEILRISYRHPDPVIAAKFANAIAQAVADRQVDLYSRPGVTEFFAKQLHGFEQDYKRASRELEEFSTKTQIYSAADQQRLLLTRLNDLSSALATTRGQIAGKTGERQTLAESLRHLAPVARSPYVTGLVDSLGGGDLANRSDNRLAERAGDYPSLLLVRVYQDSMAALFKMNAELTGAQNLQKQQEIELANLTAELNNISKSQARYVELKRAVDQAVYNLVTYANRTTLEKINAEAGTARFSSVKILQQAIIPLTPVSPNLIFMTILAVGGGVLAGIAATMLRYWTVNFSRSAKLDTDSVTRYS